MLDFAAAGFGAVAGLTLGVAGVGAVFAVPLLVYGVGLPPHQGICVSMVAVTATALAGSMQQARSELVDIRAGVLVASSGIAGAPLGAWLTRFLLPRVLLALFALVAAAVAVTMLTRTDRREASPAQTQRPWVMILTGFGVGMIAGLLGVGGGFMVVPALVFFGAMEVHRAVATALPVVALIGIAAVAGHFLAGQRVPVAVTLLLCRRRSSRPPAWFQAGGATPQPVDAEVFCRSGPADGDVHVFGRTSSRPEQKDQGFGVVDGFNHLSARPH